jgi:nitrous oxidase accessory protein
VDRLQYRHPIVKLLLGSPAIQALRLLSQQFPVLRVPSVVDQHPAMVPFSKNWSEWRDKQFR